MGEKNTSNDVTSVVLDGYSPDQTSPNPKAMAFIRPDRMTMYRLLPSDVEAIQKQWLFEIDEAVSRVTHGGQGLLHIVAAEGQDEAGVLIAKSGADVNRKDCNRSTPLHCATLYSLPQMCQTLMQMNASPTDKPKQMPATAQSKKPAVIDKLGEYITGILKGTQDKDEPTPAKKQWFDQFEKSVAAKTTHGGSLLTMTASLGHDDACVLLIEAGSDIHNKKSLGENALYYANLLKLPKTSALLIKMGAKPNTPIKNDNTAVIDTLLKSGAQDDHGAAAADVTPGSPLSKPVSVANHSAVNMLLKMTSSESARPKKGNAP